MYNKTTDNSIFEVKVMVLELKNINKSLYLDVKSVLEKNKKERHIRGGEATKQKYLVESSTTNQ